MKKRSITFVLISLVFILLFLVGCVDEPSTPDSPTPDKDTEPDNEVKPDLPDPTKSVFKNISYGQHERQVLDIFLPQELGKKATSNYYIFMFIHGGGFNSGDKDDVSFFVESVLDSGSNMIAAVSINYRFLDDGADYLDMLADIDLALSFLKDIGKDYKLATNNKVVLLGDGEGAYLAMLYSYSKTNHPIPVGIVVSKSGVCDFTDVDYYKQNEVVDTEQRLNMVSRLVGVELTPDNLLNGFPEEVRIASVVEYSKRKNLPYTLLLYGKLDLYLPYTNYYTLYNNLQSVDKTKSEQLLFQNSDHNLTSDPENFEKGMSMLTLAFFNYIFK